MIKIGENTYVCAKDVDLLEWKEYNGCYAILYIKGAKYWVLLSDTTIYFSCGNCDNKGYDLAKKKALKSFEKIKEQIEKAKKESKI